MSAVAAEGQPPSDSRPGGSLSDSTGRRSGGLPVTRSRSHSDESDDSMCIRVLPGHPQAGRLDGKQLHDRRCQDFIDQWSAINGLKQRVEEPGNTVADSKENIKELRKVTEKLEMEAANTKEEVIPLTGMVAEAQKSATQAVEEGKHHEQVAILLKDRLDAVTTQWLEEHGEVRGTRSEAPPHRVDVEPAAPLRDPYRQRERWILSSRAPPAQSSAALSARAGRVLSTPP